MLTISCKQVGQLRANITELLPHATYVHKLTVCALDVGSYKLVATCETPDTTDGCAIVALSITASL